MQQLKDAVFAIMNNLINAISILNVLPCLILRKYQHDVF